MAERHSIVEKQRLKTMLSDAVRVLCQNSVRYSAQLSIEAVIGITVDGGKDCVIVSLNEQVSKQAADTTYDEELNYDENLYTEADYMDEENNEYPAEEDDQEHYNSGELYVPYGTVVKQELKSEITYGNVGKSQFKPSSPSVYKMEHNIDNAEPAGYYDEFMNQQNVQSWPAAARTTAETMRSGHAAGYGAPKRAKLASPGGKKIGGFGGKVSTKPAPVGKVQPPLNGEDEVAQITLYTCGTCGTQMKNYTSFMRHKKSHTGEDSYSCQGCGKVIRRHDNLVQHQRRCQAYLSMAGSDDQQPY